jgi:hypothetical protein
MEEIEQQEKATESLSFSFVNDDIHIDMSYESPEDLALLFFSVISGAMTLYVTNNAKEIMPQKDYEEFLTSINELIKMTTDNNDKNSESPLIKPSELFNMETTK